MRYYVGTKVDSTNEQVAITTQIFKNDKDFAQFAKKVGKILNDVLT